MPKEEWGVKRVCPTTGKRFYDLNRRPVVSPYSGEVVEIEKSSGKAAAAAPAKPEKTPEPKEAKTTGGDALLVDDEGEAVEVDDDLLEDDDDDTVALDDLSDVADKEDE